MNTENYHEPEGALGKMHDKIHVMDPRNWQADEFDRAWKMGREEMLYDLESLLDRHLFPPIALAVKNLIDENFKNHGK